MFSLVNDKQEIFNTLLGYETACLRHQTLIDKSNAEQGFWEGVVYRVHDHYLTSAIDVVDEIINPPEVTPVPGASPWLLGLANVRGNLVAIVDLGGYLFNQRTPQTAGSRLLMTQVHNFSLGLFVDGVMGQRHFEQGQRVSLDSDAEKATEHLPEALRKHINHGYEQADRRWWVLNLERFTEQREFLDAGQSS